jgi:hypothetical protein
MEPRNVINPTTATATVKPGHIVEYTNVQSLGKSYQPKVQPNSTAGSYNKLVMIALEDALQGKTTDDAYASGQPAQVWIPRRGDRGYVRLANGQNVTQGTSILTPTTDGTFIAYVEALSAAALERWPVCVCLESVDMSSSSGADPTADGWTLVEFL